MNLSIALLTIGDELLSGERRDAHTATLGDFLGRHGYRVSRSVTVGDDEAEIGEALQSLAARYRVVIATGGLGGTEDDRTARAAAKALGRRLTLHDEALAQVKERLRQLDRPVQPHHERMALLPHKAGPLGNPVGLAPGFHLSWQQADLFFLPGVPAELQAMLENSLLPRLRRIGPGDVLAERRLRVFGLPESAVEQRLIEAGLPEGVSLGYAVDHPYVTVKLRADGREAPARVDQAEVAALQALGEHAFGRDGQTLAEVVARLLIDARLTLALAESCTGGLVAAQLTDIPGSSAFLERCGVVYADRAKQDWLGVPELVLREHGAVSRECALMMARGARQAAQSDIAVAVTGIAGPGGGSPEKPVGAVYVALSTVDGAQAKGYQFHGDRQRVRAQSAATALDWIRRYLLQRRQRG